MTLSHAELSRHLTEALAQFLDPEEARWESRRWLEEGLGVTWAWLAAHGQEPVAGPAAAQVEAWLERRRTGEPWSYILGWSEFRGRRFKVSPATLIPRPETELVLEAALDLGRRLNVLHACDIGTGTGILGITLALETDWAVVATDLSAGALAVARDNAAALGARLDFRHGDLLAAVADPVGLVVSNPPHVDPADEPTLQRELAFEPRSAPVRRRPWTGPGQPAAAPGLAPAGPRLRPGDRRGAGRPPAGPGPGRRLAPDPGPPGPGGP